MLTVLLLLLGFLVTKTDTRSDPCKNKANFKCDFPMNCQLGQMVTVKCKNIVGACQPEVQFDETAECRFCYQTYTADHRCQIVTNCSTSSQKLVKTSCTVNDDIICIGRRTFPKMVHCKWTSGISWTKTMILSVVLGGFGADRFYLGLWKSAIGKLFSFGGLGIWTIVDVVLIAIGYIKPGDGSNYV